MVQQSSQHRPQSLYRPLCRFAEQPLELTEGQLDRIEVRALRWQIRYPTTR